MATKFTSATQNALKLISPEIKELPPTWTASFENKDPYEIFYSGPGGKRTYKHPALGPLPEDWKLCYYLVDKKKKLREPRYVNTKTKQAITENPRYLPETLKARQNQKAPCMQTRIGSSIIKNGPGVMADARRGPIGSDPALRDKYEIVHTIDDGGGLIGGMNGGVFVVQLKGKPELYVEKRFKAAYWSLVRREVELVYRVRHCGVTLFCAGFVDDLTQTASLITEFCDRGSWDNLIKKYKERRVELNQQGITEDKLPAIPELFIWHAFLGIADAFAYLQGGRSYVNDPVDDEPAGPIEGWIPLLHRDMKPDNVLMRSRSTLASSKYFYCMLTDFGVACEDNGTDTHQQSGGKLGTLHYQPPELCYNPYPQDQNQRNYYPDGARHSNKTDIWALGISIYNLTKVDPPYYERHKDIWEPYPHAPVSHLQFETQPRDADIIDWLQGKAARISDLSVPAEYSDALNSAVLRATSLDACDRPDAIQLVKELTRLLHDNGVSATGPRKESERLPPWATTIPDFYGRLDI